MIHDTGVSYDHMIWIWIKWMLPLGQTSFPNNPFSEKTGFEQNKKKYTNTNRGSIPPPLAQLQAHFPIAPSRALRSAKCPCAHRMYSHWLPVPQMAHRNFLKFSSARNKEVTSVLVQYQYQYQYNYSIIYSNSSNILTLRKTLWKNSTVKVTFTSGSPSFARCIAVAFFFASLFSLE